MPAFQTTGCWADCRKTARRCTTCRRRWEFPQEEPHTGLPKRWEDWLCCCHHPNCWLRRLQWRLATTAASGRIRECVGELWSNPSLLWAILESERSEEHTSELQSLRHLVCRL